MIVFVLLFMIYCIADGYEDARYPVIYHFRATLLRIATGIAMTYVYCGVMAPVWLYVNMAAIQAFTFWCIFDIARNLADGEDWNYIGETASWDKWLRQFSPAFAWTMKFLLMVASVVVYYIFFDGTFTTHTNSLIRIYHGLPG